LPPDEDASVYRIVVVMCPNEHCLRDLQVRLEDGEDASPELSCPSCGTKFWVSLPTSAE
jgi:hypothetical protein